jgi:hypothetical protein
MDKDSSHGSGSPVSKGESNVSANPEAKLPTAEEVLQAILDASDERARRRHFL